MYNIISDAPHKELSRATATSGRRSTELPTHGRAASHMRRSGTQEPDEAAQRKVASECAMVQPPFYCIEAGINVHMAGKEVSGACNAICGHCARFKRHLPRASFFRILGELARWSALQMRT